MTKLSSQQRRELRKLQGRAPLCVSALEKAECFVLTYISFEAQARKVWHYYRCRKKSKTESKSGIPITELAKALEHFEIQFDDKSLNDLLDSKSDKRGSKSARNLRNGIFHQWTEGDCREAESRYEGFHASFQNFNRAIRGVL